MGTIRRAGIAAAVLMLGGLARAEDGVPYDAAPDVPRAVATDIFGPPERLSPPAA
jgi:hypothetical protein